MTTRALLPTVLPAMHRRRTPRPVSSNPTGGPMRAVPCPSKRLRAAGAEVVRRRARATPAQKHPTPNRGASRRPPPRHTAQMAPLRAPLGTNRARRSSFTSTLVCAPSCRAKWAPRRQARTGRTKRRPRGTETARGPKIPEACGKCPRTSIRRAAWCSGIQTGLALDCRGPTRVRYVEHQA